jgi:glycine/D-amino acid oxidase-like deaminating enzyme
MTSGTVHDVVIVGHGIAGASLAWEFLLRGHQPLVIDRLESTTSSLVAAGIVTPITGQRVALGWRIADFWPVAAAFYHATAALLGTNFFHRLPHVRLLSSADEARRWAEKQHDPAFKEWLVSPAPDPLLPHGIIPSPGFAMHSGWLDAPNWLAASRDFLRARNALLHAEAGPVTPNPNGPATLQTSAGPITARHIVFCQGHEASSHPLFSWLRWKSAKGEILDLNIPNLPSDRILNRGIWLLPLGGNRFRTGSGYAWDDFSSTPTPAARAAIESKLQNLLQLPYTVTGHSAAVRPIIRESRAVIGRHPSHPAIAFFNGLGSKGVLHAPWYARQLADCLLHNSPVEYESDLCRND